jgi:hypothetical protein
MADPSREKPTEQMAPRTERKHPRYPYITPVTYRELGPAKTGRILNLSEGGLMVELPERCPRGTAFDLLIHLDQRSIHPQAEVVWSQERSDQTPKVYLHGLKFTRLDLQDRLTLELFLAVALDGKGGPKEGR